MFPTRKSHLGMLAIALTSVVLVSCGGAAGGVVDTNDTPPPFQASYDCLTREVDQNAPDNQARLAELTLDRPSEDELSGYVPNMVIVTGVLEDRDANGIPDIQTTMDIVLGPDSDNFLLDQFTMTLPDGRVVIIRAYDLVGTPFENQSVWDVVLAIVAVAFDLDYSVLADPNYIVADPYDAQGSPYDAQGSPYDAQGSPYDAQGSPFAPASAVDIPPLSSLLRDQAAFDHASLDTLETNEANATATLSQPIVIFDTSPYDEGTESETGIHHGYYGLNFELCNYRHPQIIVPDGEGNIADHGLSVAALAAAVSPDSQVHLYRVLNDDGIGHMFMVAKAMSFYLDAAEEQIDEGVSPVINLSLGFNQSAGTTSGSDSLPHARFLLDEEISQDENAIAFCGYINDSFPSWNIPVHYTDNEAIAALVENSQFPYVRGGCGDPENDGLTGTLNAWRANVVGAVLPIETFSDELVSVVALRLVTLIATGRGASIVAAAGNDSYPDAQPAQRPAIWPEVIAVGAINLDGARSCYSNKGDVYVPGGDGNSECRVDFTDSSCVGEAANMTCRYGVLSLGAHDPEHTPPLPEFPPNTPDLPLSYKFFVGTSFATPLCSGLQALGLECPAPEGVSE